MPDRPSRRLALPPHRARLDRELDDELRIHLEMRADALRQRGFSADAARAEALRQFGDLDDARDYCRREDHRRLREARRSLWLDDLRQDVRAAWRQLRRSPAFAVAAVLVLAAGIGAATAVYGVVDAYLVRPLPYPHPERLVHVLAGPSRDPFPNAPSLDDVDWRAVEPLFEATVAWNLDGFTVAGGAGAGDAAAEFVYGAWVSPGYGPTLGVRPALGRAFRADDFTSRARVAIVSDALWARRFGRDPGVIGRAVRIYSADRPLDAELVTIVGVLPRDWWHVDRFTDVLRPLPEPAMPSLARLRPGVSIARAEAALNAAVRPQLGAVDPAWRMSLVGLQDEYTHELRPMLLAVMAGAACMLLIAAASVAGALVMRATGRRAELAVRATLGASRGRIVRQLLTESLLLTALASLGGTLLATLLLRLLGPAIAERLGATVPGAAAGAALSPSVGTLALAVGASALLGVAFGMLPALASTRRGAGGAALRGARDTGEGAGLRGAWLRRTLIGAQLALTTTLLVGAALMTRTAVRLATTPLGFRAEGVLVGHVLFPRGRYPDAPARRAVAARTLAAVRAAPGVRDAALVFPHPYRGAWPSPVVAEGRAVDAGQAPRAVQYVVSPGYFAVMDVALRAGRAFDERDDAAAPPAVVISEGLARRLWPDERALGRRLRLRDDATWRTVVGVVADTRKPMRDEALPDAYVPLAQGPPGYASIVARASGDASGDAGALAPALRRAVAGVDDALAVAEPTPLEAIVARDGARPRALAGLLGGFAALALGLAVLGLFSSLSYLVSQRRRELAVRAAVGADAGRLARAVLGEGARTAAVGLAAGALLSLALRRVLATQLWGVSAGDPVSLAAIAAILGAAALAAMAVPARRAARTDPARALRGE